MKKGDEREAGREAGARTARRKEKSWTGITLLPADSGSNFALRNSGNGSFGDEIKPVETQETKALRMKQSF